MFPYAFDACVMNSTPPVMNMTAKPTFDQRTTSAISFAADALRNARPSRRRSNIRIMPTDNGSARIWLPSTNGNSQIDSLTVVASGVCSSHRHQPSSDIGNRDSTRRVRFGQNHQLEYLVPSNAV